MKAEQSTQTSLLEYLAEQENCVYMSDLRFLRGLDRAHLLHEIRRLPEDRFPVEEWNEALAYLFGQPPEQTCQAAREALLSGLSESHPSGTSGAGSVCHRSIILRRKHNENDA